MVYIAFFESCQLKRFAWCWNTVEKKVYSKKTTKSIIPLLQPQHVFCQQNGPERDEVQDWYRNEKLVVVPVRTNRDEGNESLHLLAFRREVVTAIFLKYFKER